MQETHVRSLGQEDPLEEGMATHSSILAWRIPWTEEPGGCAVHGIAESETAEHRTVAAHPSPSCFQIQRWKIGMLNIGTLKFRPSYFDHLYWQQVYLL